jgi:hypothetical protein
MPPARLVKLLSCCTEVGLSIRFEVGNADKSQFIKLLKEKDQSTEGDLCLRLVFCEFLAACTYTTLARAEDANEQRVSPLLELMTQY